MKNKNKFDFLSLFPRITPLVNTVINGLVQVQSLPEVNGSGVFSGGKTYEYKTAGP